MKKVLFPLLSIFLLYQTFSLINTTVYHPVSPGFLSQFILAFLLNLFLTGVFAFIGFAYPTHQLLPLNYYRVRNPQFLARTYSFFRVDFFRNLLLLFFWGTQKNRKKYFDGTRKGFENLIFQSKQSEFGHFMAFLFVTAASMNFLVQDLYIAFILTTIINVVGNFYPILLQRHHRMRIRKIQKRFQS